MVDFTSNVVGNLSRLQPVTFVYTGDLVPEVVGYSWSFGDGCTSNEANPRHHWVTLGPKDVSLFVRRADDSVETIVKSAFVTITVDSLDDYRDLLFQKFKTSQTIRDLLTPHLEQCALLDYAVGQFDRLRSLDNYGVMLDLVGEILQLPRLGRDDVTYHTALTKMPTINRGYGQLEVIIAYTQLYMQVEHLYVFSGDMVIHLVMVGVPPVNPALFITRIRRLVAAGVAIYTTTSAGVPLEFGSIDEPPMYATGSELSELGYYDGGELSELYE